MEFVQAGDRPVGRAERLLGHPCGAAVVCLEGRVAARKARGCRGAGHIRRVVLQHNGPRQTAVDGFRKPVGVRQEALLRGWAGDPVGGVVRGAVSARCPGGSAVRCCKDAAERSNREAGGHRRAAQRNQEVIPESDRERLPGLPCIRRARGVGRPGCVANGRRRTRQGHGAARKWKRNRAPVNATVDRPDHARTGSGDAGRRRDTRHRNDVVALGPRVLPMPGRKTCIWSRGCRGGRLHGRVRGRLRNRRWTRGHRTAHARHCRQDKPDLASRGLWHQGPMIP